MYWQNSKRNRWLIVIQILALISVKMQAQNIQEDKLLHYTGGVITGGMAYSYVYYKTGDKNLAFWSGVGTAFLAGVSKEMIDAKIYNGSIDSNDILATTLGGLSVTIAIPLFSKKKKNKINLKLFKNNYEEKYNNAHYSISDQR